MSTLPEHAAEHPKIWSPEPETQPRRRASSELPRCRLRALTSACSRLAFSSLTEAAFIGSSSSIMNLLNSPEGGADAESAT